MLPFSLIMQSKPLSRCGQYVVILHFIEKESNDASHRTLVKRAGGEVMIRHVFMPDEAVLSLSMVLSC
jgi:hypothetical protein